MKSKLIGLAVLLITVFACNTSKNTQNTTVDKNRNNSEETITHEKWTLIELEGQEVSRDTKNQRDIYFTLNPEENRINGFAGCNTFFGEYKIEKGMRIRFSKLATTRMACPEGEIKEQDVLNIFEIADNYTISGDILSLNVGRRAPLAVFKKSTSKITEKYWKLKTLEGKEVKMTKNQEREIHFILKVNDNSLNGFAGCNTFNGTYTLKEGNRIEFSKIATTLKACPDVAINESEFLKVFELANNYTINGDELSLNIGKRAPLAVFEAVYF